jgi:hypothetical protein
MALGRDAHPSRDNNVAISRQKKMPDGDVSPSGMSHVVQQRLNCALPFQSSSSLGFFRFQGLNGIFKIPKNFELSRRPIQSLFKSKLFKVM